MAGIRFSSVQRALRLVLLAVLAAAFARGAFAQQVPQPKQEYRIGAGDVIRISVFQNPNLTLETRVSDDGTINYPLIGTVKIGGLSLPAAQQVIAKALNDGNYIRQPQVSILPLQVRSSQVSVLGQVNKAGRYPLETADTRVSEIIAIAGGISPGGADVAIITGERAGKPFRKEIDIAALFLDKRSAEDIAVSGGDVIYIHRAPMFYIYGEVQKPGSYRVERGMTVRQALVQGGGPTAKGTERGLRLFRRGSSGEVQPLKPGMDESVQTDDVLYVGESLF